MCYHIGSTVTKSLKCHSIFYQVCCFRVMVDMVISGNSKNVSPLPHSFLRSEILVLTNRNTVSREGKSLPRINIYSCGNSMLSLLFWKWSLIINLLSVSSMSHLRGPYHTRGPIIDLCYLNFDHLVVSLARQSLVSRISL